MKKMWVRWGVLVVGAFAMPGCIFLFPPFGAQIGSTIDTATPVTLDADNSAKLNGTISGDKIDVYDLGAVVPGDHVVVSVQPVTNPTGRYLDPTAAIFDANNEVFGLNDDVDYPAGRIDSLIDGVVSIASDHFYLAITRSFAAQEFDGAYEATATITHGELVRPATQFLLLNFAGGSVNIPSDGTFTFPKFDAADLETDSHTYAGMTAQIKAKIVETVRQNYRNTGVQIVTSDDPMPGGNVSTVHFGHSSSTKFGVSQEVDDNNHNCCDESIVFTTDFAKPGIFANQPSADGIAIAIGNVAAHEAGHLLGLNHVTDVTDLMDTTGSASTLLTDQEFKTAPLFFQPRGSQSHPGSIFPFGQQNGPAILSRLAPQ